MVIGRKKVWSIAYADDIVLLARSEQELKGVMKRFKKYIDKKGLTVSLEKSKVMFRKRKRRQEKERMEMG